MAENPGYTSEKPQMIAEGSVVVPDTQPLLEIYPQTQQPPPHYPQPTGGQQPYPQPFAGQQPYPPPPAYQPYPAGQIGHPQPAVGQAYYPLPAAQPAVVGGNQTVIISQPQGGGIVNFGPSPVTMTCPNCSKQVTTTTEINCCSCCPWLVCGIICLIGLVLCGSLWLGCCLIPFCIPSLYDVNHTCPNCNSQVGYYTKR